jgi:hypothetical protein
MSGAPVPGRRRGSLPVGGPVDRPVTGYLAAGDTIVGWRTSSKKEVARLAPANQGEKRKSTTADAKKELDKLYVAGVTLAFASRRDVSVQLTVRVPGPAASDGASDREGRDEVRTPTRQKRRCYRSPARHGEQPAIDPAGGRRVAWPASSASASARLADTPTARRAGAGRWT